MLSRKVLDALRDEFNDEFDKLSEKDSYIQQMKANTEKLRKDSGSDETEGVEIINDAPKETGQNLGNHNSEVSADI